MTGPDPAQQSTVANSASDIGGRASVLLPVVYQELRMIAEQRLRTIAPGSSIQPTELLHEAYARLVRKDDASFETRRHFIAAAALAMRSVLVDRARAQNAIKRGGDRYRVPLEGLEIDINRPPEEVLAIDVALTKLESVDPRSAQVVILRFYLGLSEVQIAHVLGVTDRTVRRDWIFAKHWLQRELSSASSTAPADEPPPPDRET
ncbi:MAG: sigma-70 family RNA polymerase sigma factor [Phycisphaerales bacterium]|nr:sigma-70 family RNA polymerase sigma factor [Phycisphaerales bacterium]